MRKVTTINLNGRAYQLEEEGYDALKTYLIRAGKALAGNPDKSEILLDIEQAIADKCDQALSGNKNVISEEKTHKILEEMGEVEDGETGTDHAGEESQHEGREGRRPKRLFVIREGAMVLGVCKGLGAFFGVDTNLVRLAFVLLAIFTSGFGIAIYFALGIFLPQAKTDAEVAEAYGEPMTAQAIADRVRERVADPETIKRYSATATTAANQFAKVVMRIINITLMVVFGVATAAWLWLLWNFVVNGFDASGSLAFLNSWMWVLATLAYLLLALPVLLLVRSIDRAVVGKGHGASRTDAAMAAVWVLALAGLISFSGAYGQRLYDYAEQHGGYVDIQNRRVCVDDSRCRLGEQQWKD
jgi:phage shock protein PspC (stress-responsive transcriptional regulator)